jgi:type IV secretory pathway TraG/TraD family ATPase VirD4
MPTLSARWTWAFFLILAIAAGFPLLPLPRVSSLFPVLGNFYLPAKVLCVVLMALFLVLAGLFLVFGDAEDVQQPKTPAPKADALTLGWAPDADWIRLRDNTLLHHALVLGSSGSGKTQLLLSLLAQQIQRGGGCLMIDAKVDRAALLTILSLCKAADRLEDLRILWPPDNQISHTWNPLLRGKLPEVLSRVMALWGTTKGGEGDFWRGSAHTAIHAVLGAMKQCNKLITFNDLYIALTSAEALLYLERNCSSNTEAHSALTSFLTNFRNAKGQLNVDYMKRMIGGVPQYLSAYAWGELGKIMNTTQPSLDLLEALKKGQIVYVALPILAETETATAMARMLIADLKQAVGALQQDMDRPRVPYLVLMDEASAYMNVEGVDRLFEQARSAGVGLVAAAQVVSGFSQIDKSRQDFIFGNTATKVIMRLGDFNSAETMSKTIGEGLAMFASTSSSHSKSRSAPWVSPVPDKSATGESESTQIKQQYDYLIRPEEFMDQKTGEAVIFAQDPLLGAHLYKKARLVYLQLPGSTWQKLPTVAHPNPPGLDLITRIPQTATSGIASSADGGGGGGGGPRPPKSRKPKQKSEGEFTVVSPAEPMGAAPPQEA